MNIVNLISNKRIVLALGMIVVVAAVVVSGTGAFFSDSESSANNVFTAGSIDLMVDHSYASYNGENCNYDCVEDGSNLIVNGGFEDPAIAGGSYAIYPAGIPGWDVESGAGIEIQDNAAGLPHSGDNLVELDSDNQSAMSQDIVTVPGEKYRLSFWYSPRPNVAIGDNTLGFEVTVVGSSTVLFSDTVGDTDAGGANTAWRLVTVDFVAVSASTQVLFSDEGALNNSLGGYLDDVSVKHLTCADGDYVETPGGFCELWSKTNLTDEAFFTFNDVKPGDWGTNGISLHVSSNDGLACVFPHGMTDNENIVIEPESDASDVTPANGELDKYLYMVTWKDADADGIIDIGAEAASSTGPTLFNAGFMASLPLTAGDEDYLGIAWCVGTMTLPTPGQPFTAANCDGAGNHNDAQTDSITAYLTAYAEQSRNNAFTCADLSTEEREAFTPAPQIPVNDNN